MRGARRTLLVTFAVIASAAALMLRASRAGADAIGDPLPAVTKTWDALAADFDGQNGADILLTTQDALNGNDGGIYFADGAGGWVMGFRFPPDDRHGCAAGDVNGDGRLDAMCTIGAVRGTGLGPDELWIQQPDGSFLNQASSWGLTDPYGRGRRAALFDHNGDGLLDLYVENYRSRPDGQNNDNHLYINQGDHFTERITAATGELGSRCLTVGDLDGDGWLDLLVCGPTLRLFRNQAGDGHEDVDSWLGNPVQKPQDVQLSDVNGDGLSDMVLVLRHDVEIRLNRITWHPTQPFSKVTVKIPLASGQRALIRDLTGDGTPDVYVTEGCVNGLDQPDVLLVGPNWQEVTLDGSQQDGCGNLAIDAGKLVVFNGTNSQPGPVTVLDYPIWTPGP